MSVNLLALTSKKVADVATFIKENASANKLRYSNEANVTHRVFFPTYVNEEGVEVPYIIAAKTHAWGEGSSYSSCICTKGVAVEGTEFDGTCPVCERLTDASDIVNYVKAEREAASTLVGEARKKFIEELDKEMWRDRKVAPAKTRYYVALAQLKCDREGRALLEGEDNFTLHIASWTANTMNKFIDSLTMQDDEPNLGGREFKIKYGDYNDVMTRVGQAQVSVVAQGKALVEVGNALHKKVMEAMEKFDFQRSIELARPEVETKTPTQIKTAMNTLFREWDNYKAALAVNPDAKYLEYSAGAAPASTTGAPTAPTNAIADGAQAGTTGGEVSVDELDAALGL